MYLDRCYRTPFCATAWIGYLHDIAFVHGGVDREEASLGLYMRFDRQPLFLGSTLAVDDFDSLGTH